MIALPEHPLAHAVALALVRDDPRMQPYVREGWIRGHLGPEEVRSIVLIALLDPGALRRAHPDSADPIRAEVRKQAEAQAVGDGHQGDGHDPVGLGHAYDVARGHDSVRHQPPSRGTRQERGWMQRFLGRARWQLGFVGWSWRLDVAGPRPVKPPRRNHKRSEPLESLWLPGFGPGETLV